MGSKKATWLVIFAPLSVMLLVWAIQLLYYEVFGNSIFNPVSLETWGVVSLGVFGFTIGALSVSIFAGGTPAISSPDQGRGFGGFKFVCFSLALFVIVNNLLLPVFSGISVSELRNQALEDWTAGGIGPRINAVLLNGLCCFIILIISRIYEQNKKVSFFWIVLFAILCVACFARTLLLIGMSIILLRVLLQGKNPIRMIVLSLLGFVMVFMVLAWLMKDDASGDESLEQVLIHHLQIYFFGGISGLNHYVMENTPSYNSILTVPRFLQFLLPGELEFPPSFYDFVETPGTLNVFTSMYPPYHDFGLVGVALFFLFYGACSTVACILFVKTNKAVWQTIAGFLIYATTMTIFDDQFLRGLPVLLIFVFFAVIFDWLRYAFFDRAQYAE